MKLNAAIVGLPNTGKTTLFNVLTHQSLPVANWAGVTVKSVSGRDQREDQLVWIDLPGVQTLQFSQKTMLPDDVQITHDYLLQNKPDILVNVVDARYLIRDFYLTSQLAELNIPMVVLLNFTESCPYVKEVIEWGERFFGINILAVDLQDPDWVRRLHLLVNAKTIADVSGVLEWYRQAPYSGLPTTKLALQQLSGWVEGGAFSQPLILQAATWRYNLLDETLKAWKNKSSQQSRLDEWLLHPIWGGAIFFTVMIMFFGLSIGVGGGMQEYISKAGIWALNKLFFDDRGLVGCFCIAMMMCVSFWPVLFVTYGLQSILSESGYIPRMVLIIDRWFRAWNLSGQSFIPLLLGFGCNVPAIMSTRTMSYRVDRLVTALMIPFIACSARLSLFVLFALAFYPNHSIVIVLGLYLISLLVAGMVGFFAGNYWVSSKIKPLIQQLPPLHVPLLKGILKRSAFKSNAFILRMSKTVIPLLVVLQALSHVDVSTGVSVIEGLGRFILPCFYPLGLTPDAWPLMVALLAGLIAKEVMLGALLGMLVLGVGGAPSVWLASPEVSSLSGTMVNALGGFFVDSSAVFSFLVFVLLYVPCVATMVALSSEFGRAWALRSFMLSLCIGYLVAFSIYQGAIFTVLAFSCLMALAFMVRYRFNIRRASVYPGS
ncbi:MAG TPA: ferrous iron transporter B [Gammaproteobacteria bacterium]|nr:ferrous iron transporter B [Gammaproteobacteria bacterium]